MGVLPWYLALVLWSCAKQTNFIVMTCSTNSNHIRESLGLVSKVPGDSIFSTGTFALRRWIHRQAVSNQPSEPRCHHSFSRPYFPFFWVSLRRFKARPVVSQQTRDLSPNRWLLEFFLSKAINPSAESFYWGQLWTAIRTIRKLAKETLVGSSD